MRKALKFGVLAAALLSVIAWPAWADKPMPPLPPPAGPADIVYAAAVGTGGELSIMQHDGSGKQVIYASRDHPIGMPDWSHDGKLVAFNNQNSISVLELATGKTCVLAGSMTGLDPVQGAPKFHPGYPNATDSGTYVIAWNDYTIQRFTGKKANDIFSTAFRFQEGTCLLTLPIWNLTMTPDVDEKGVAWSPSADHLATIITGTGYFEHRLRVYDAAELQPGRISFINMPVDHSLALGYLAVYQWDETTLQWKPNSTRVAVIGKWKPDGVTPAGDVVFYDVVTEMWSSITNRPQVQGYFDFMPDGVGMVVQHADGIHLFPGDTLLAPVEMRNNKVMCTPIHAAWNPTRQ
ncbi:MAG: hypothetical protein HY049_00020 [Acidobacteria bacterium]|nr:hypothetical protein [Acidobacteriota bacterium]